MTRKYKLIRDGMTPEERALDRLNTLIDGSWLFGDTCENISREESISKARLMTLYEKQFSLNFIEEWREFCNYLHSKGAPMGKIILRGPGLPDNPMFSGVVDFFRKSDSNHEPPATLLAGSKRSLKS